jgi:antirestriction protein ArdC
MHAKIKEALDAILKQIEAGVMPWQSSWISSRPANATTRRKYRGVNVLLLWAAQQKHEFPTAQWATFKQWHSIGAKVNKGAKATFIVFHKAIEKTNDYGDKTVVPFFTTTWLFNAAQVSGWTPATKPHAANRQEAQAPIAEAEALVARLKPTIVSGGGDPAYYPIPDHITMPLPSSFDNMDNYYRTLFHELMHWTGAEHRLNRLQFKRHDLYAVEELVAEIGASTLAAEFGLKEIGRDSSAAYVQNWMKAIPESERAAAIMSAATMASAAIDWMQIDEPVEQEMAA